MPTTITEEEVEDATEAPGPARRAQARADADIKTLVARAKAYGADESVAAFTAYLAGSLSVAYARECEEAESLRDLVGELRREIGRLREPCRCDPHV